jgi:hypothetical protein
MKTRSLAIFAIVAAVSVVGCSSQRYEPQPVGGTPAPAAAPAASPAVVIGGDQVAGIVEWGRAWYGASKAKGEGQFTINGDLVNWTNLLESDNSFSLRAPVIQEVWLTCASRPGQNLCLDLGIRTVTEMEFHFRDRNWLGGDNGSILRVYNALKEKFPTISFSEKVVKSID